MNSFVYSHNTTPLHRARSGNGGTAKELDYARDQHDSRAQFHAGRLDKNHATQAKYWKSWCEYTEGMGVSPYLNGPGNNPDEAIMGFAARVRRGYYGRGRTVGAQTVEKAIGAVSQTFAMDQRHWERNPVMHNGRREAKLAQQLDGMRHGDKPPAQKLAVPIDTVDWMRDNMKENQCQRTVAKLCNTAFYYLLRVGKYTVTAQKRTQTTQFRVRDVIFRDKQTIIPVTALLERLRLATSATLIIDNQKNGVRGQTIAHVASMDTSNPVEHLADLVSI